MSNIKKPINEIISNLSPTPDQSSRDSQEKLRCDRCRVDLPEDRKFNSYCDKCGDERRRQIEARSRISLEREIPPKFIRDDIPLERRFKEYVPRCQRGLYLHGKTGTGKTQTAALIALESIKAGRIKGENWAFLNYPKFIMRLQASFKDKTGESADDLLSRYADIPYLIIDDLGAEKPTEFVRQSTYFLINEREMYERFTIITSNFSLKYLDENIDPRIASRIAGMADIVEMGGGDKRLLKSTQKRD